MILIFNLQNFVRLFLPNAGLELLEELSEKVRVDVFADLAQHEPIAGLALVQDLADGIVHARAPNSHGN